MLATKAKINILKIFSNRAAPKAVTKVPAYSRVKKIFSKTVDFQDFQDYASRIMKRPVYKAYLNLGKKNLMNPSQNFRPLGIFTKPMIEKAVRIDHSLLNT